MQKDLISQKIYQSPYLQKIVEISVVVFGYWLNNLYHFEKTACSMGKRSKGDRFVFWIISFIVEGSVGCLHWQAPHFYETCRNWIIYALRLFCQTGFQMDNRLKVVRGILCSRHDLLAHASFNTLGEQNKTNKNHPFWYAVGSSPPAAFLWGWHLPVQLLPVLCISKVEENWRGHSPLWPSMSEVSTEGSWAVHASRQAGSVWRPCTAVCCTSPLQHELCYRVSCWLHVICHQHLWLRGTGMLWESSHRGGDLWGKCYGTIKIIQ